MLKYVSLILFISTIFLANYLITHVGINCYPCLIPVWPGILAPSGVLAIGLGFTFRDLVQKSLGLKWAIIAILVGSLLSAILSPALALASGLAFLFSELLDLGVYTPLRKRNLTLAVLSSNLVGLVVDSALFLLIAFGSLDFIIGQVIGKIWMTLLFLPVIYWLDQKRVAYRDLALQ